MQVDRTCRATIDYQRIRIQELFCDSGLEFGRVPKSIEVELKGDLVDSCLPGDIITISGIVKVGFGFLVLNPSGNRHPNIGGENQFAILRWCQTGNCIVCLAYNGEFDREREAPQRRCWRRFEGNRQYRSQCSASLSSAGFASYSSYTCVPKFIRADCQLTLSENFRA